MSRPDNARVFGLRRAAATIGVLALFALSACTGGGIGGFGARSGGTAVPTGEILGSGPVRVALLVPLSATGNAGQLALNLRNATDLAIRDFQTAGIQVLVKDTLGTSDGARAAASQAIKSAVARISSARTVISPRLPIGVATT